MPFDQHYHQYEQWFAENQYVYLSEIAAVRHFISSSGLGMEIGVGSGQFASPLNIPFGIDPSEKMLRLAQKKRITILKSVAKHLPLKDKLFDFVLMITTICFLDDVNIAVQETRRILKPDGRLIIGLLDKNSPLGQIYQAKKQQNVFYQSATFYSTEEIISLLEQNQFTNIQIVQTVFGNLAEITAIQPYKNGYGEGGFVVIRALKLKI